MNKKMHCVIHMPDLADGQAEHRLVGWLVDVGAWIKVNQSLAAVEVAKGVSEVHSPVAGRLVQLHAEPGQVLRIGVELATIDATDDPIP